MLAGRVGKPPLKVTSDCCRRNSGIIGGCQRRSVPIPEGWKRPQFLMGYFIFFIGNKRLSLFIPVFRFPLGMSNSNDPNMIRLNGIDYHIWEIG